MAGINTIGFERTEFLYAYLLAPFIDIFKALIIYIEKKAMIVDGINRKPQRHTFSGNKPVRFREMSAIDG